MKKQLLLAVAVAFSCVLSRGYAATADDHLRDLLKAMNALADAIEKKDEAKERQSEARIKELESKLDDLKLSAEDRKKLAATHKDDIARVTGRVFTARFSRERPTLTHDAVMRDLIKALNSLADALEKKDVKDVRAVIGKLKDLKKTASGMKDPSEDEKKRLMEKYKEDMTKAQGRMLSAMTGVADNKEIMEALKELADLK